MSTNANSKRRQRRMRELHGLQLGVCADCREPVMHPDERQSVDHFDGPLAPTIEHVVPRSKGGFLWDLRNMLLEHRLCNMRREDGPLPASAREMWRANLKKIGT